MIRTLDRMDELSSYYSEYRAKDDGELFETVSFADMLEQWTEKRKAGPQRWEVLNRCERTPIPSLKRALIHERDGNACVYCGEGGHVLTVDHIIPRSAFPEHMIHIADRSDNLNSACWPCNKRKSNYHRERSKRPGVTRACWECLNPGPEEDGDWDAHEAWGNRAAVSRNHLVYCGRCGMGGTVPNTSWVL